MAGLRIAYLEIDNFRGIKRAKLRLAQHNVFIGPNNSGKTTIIEALALLFGRDRLLRPLTEYDFFGGDPKPDTRIRITATIVGFDPNDSGEHPEWFRMGRAVPKWLDDTTGELHPSAEDESWLLACQVVYVARFDQELLEAESVRFFCNDDVPGDPFLDDTALSPFPSQLVRDLGFLFVPASRSWDRVMSFGSELFKRVVTSAGGKPSKSVLIARDALRKPSNPLEADPNLKELVEHLNNELAGFFIDDPKLHLRVTSTDAEGVLEAVIPHYSRAQKGLELPARRQGSGLVSLQWLLLLLELARKRAENGLPFLMALEEPELHVPPALQKRLVHRIQSLSAQTFVSTHSPVVAAMAKLNGLWRLHNADGSLSAIPLALATPSDQTPNSLRVLFFSRKHETISALMHDAVLVPEGYIDFVLLQVLARSVDVAEGWDKDSICTFSVYVGIVPTQDAAVVATTQHLLTLHRNVSAIVDGDSNGRSYASGLTKLATRPVSVARWCDAWSLEDLIGWMLSADSQAALANITPHIQTPVASIDELVERLKVDRHVPGGLKTDQMLYEIIGDTVATVESIRCRARDVLNALADIALGRPTRLFKPSVDDPDILVFSP